MKLAEWIKKKRYMVETSNHLTDLRNCLNKRWFPNRKDAEKSIMAHAKLKAYECDICKRWHLTTDR